MKRIVLVLLASAALAGCLGGQEGRDEGVPEQVSAVVPMSDPLVPGPFGVAQRSYDLGHVEVGGPDATHSGYAYEHRLAGAMYVPDGEARHPLVVLLHGQHATCDMAGQEAPMAVDDCGDEDGVNRPYANHLGYEYLGRFLASHGIAVASILGHEVNEQNGAPDVGMWARGELILATIDALDAWSQIEGTPLHGRIDTDRIGLMGHSRGGEGVVTALHVNSARPTEHRWPIDAVVALAPTDFNERPAIDAAFLAVVPYCDGDVYLLDGLRIYDRSTTAAHNRSVVQAQALVMGANHNFYNRNWWDGVGPVRAGDDTLLFGLYSTPPCALSNEVGGGRLSPADVEAQALLHIGGFLRWTLQEEAGLGPYLTGAAATPPAGCPSGSAPCPGAVHLSFHEPGARFVLDVSYDELEASGLDAIRPCSFDDCSLRMYSAAPAVELRWTGEASVTTPPIALGDQDVLSLRFAVDVHDGFAAAAPPPVLHVSAIGDGWERRVAVAVHSSAVYVPPGRSESTQFVSDAKIVLNDVRIPLAAFALEGGDMVRFRIDLQAADETVVYLGDVRLQHEAAAWRTPVGAWPVGPGALRG